MIFQECSCYQYLTSGNVAHEINIFFNYGSILKDVQLTDHSMFPLEGLGIELEI